MRADYIAIWRSDSYKDEFLLYDCDISDDILYYHSYTVLSGIDEDERHGSDSYMDRSKFNGEIRLSSIRILDRII